MADRLFPAAMAILLGVGVGVLVFVPFVAIQYRREGRLTLRRTALWGCFLVYGLALWTYTLLPMPDPGDIRCVAGPQLRPFQFVTDIIDEGGIRSVADVVRNPAVMQVALNVALFTPLGFFLRLAWQRGVVASTVVGLLLSVTIEATQATGVWGLYPCAYRLLDVDDLLTNTAGALLGGLASLALRHSRWRHDPGAATAPRPVTVWRRLLGMVCDVLGMWLTGSLAAVLVNAWQRYGLGVAPAEMDPLPATVAAGAVPFVVFGALTLLTGRTVGDHAVLLRWDGADLSAPLARGLRYLAGIGGWQLLTSLDSLFDALLVLASLIAVIATRHHGGLPGLASRQRPVDDRSPEPD